MSTLHTPNRVLAVAYVPQDDDLLPLSPDYFRRNMLLALDGVQDPGNMGTIIRIADWFGIRTVLASENSVEFYNPKVVQASMGSLFRVKLRQLSLVEVFKSLKVSVYGALLEGRNIYEEEFGEKGILLLGNESKGISPELKAYITHPVTIPRFGAAESLNVATAAAVICSEIRRKF
ncbi:MAG TPA: RNA methyltransferase [Anseongella sp.]|nr:RNA methyltransferase [Anseongella sp.]